MFGADTALVMDALQIAGVAAVVGIGGFALFLKLRKNADTTTDKTSAKDNLEDRVRVLERIATDRTQDLKDEIEQLRDSPAKQEQA